MDAIKGIFETITEKVPLVTALLMLKLIYQYRPYAAAITAVRICRQNSIPTTLLISISFLLFALALGLPSTQHLIVGFDTGISDTLRKLSQISARDSLFYYLVLFVTCSTIVVIFMGMGISNLLNLKRFDRRLFLDIFYVYVCFTIWNFIVLSIFFSVLSIVFAAKTTTKIDTAQFASLDLILEKAHLSEISTIVKNYSFIATIGLAIFFGYKLLIRWGSRKSISKKYKYAKRSVLFVVPALTGATVIVFPSIIIVSLAKAMWSKQEQHTFYVGRCYVSGGKILLNAAITNASDDVTVMDPLVVALKNPRENLTPARSLRLEPTSILWSSRMGVFLQPRETRYVRISALIDRLGIDLVSCDLLNPQEIRQLPAAAITSITPTDADSISTFGSSGAIVQTVTP